MKALVFASRDVPNMLERARRLAERLTERGVKTRVIDKLSSDLNDLLLVAEHGVVEPAAFVLLDTSGVRVRLTGVPTMPQANAAIRRLRETPN